MTSERWLPVVGFESSYEVSDLGRVRSCARTIPLPSGRTRRIATRILRQKLNTSGYPCVGLHRNGIHLVCRVHCLVAVAFLGNAPTPRHEVAHGDGVRTNAGLSNLRWATRAENVADTLVHGTDNRGERHYGSKLTAGWVASIRSLAASGLGSVALAGRFGVARQTIRDVVAGRTWRSVA